MLLADVENQLAAAGLLFDPQSNTPGFMLIQQVDGFLICNVAKDGSPRKFNETQISKLKALFPSIKEFLVVNSDTQRRAVSLHERLKNMASEGAVSLDTDDSRPIPSSGVVDIGTPSSIPRSYLLIDDCSTAKNPHYVFSIFGSELSLANTGGNVRADEALFQFEIPKSSDSSKLIQSIMSGAIKPAEALKGVVVSNCRVIYYDDNNPLRGKKRVEHHAKSLTTIAAWMEHIGKTYNFKISGPVSILTVDHFAYAAVSSGLGGPAVGRFNIDGVDRQSIFCVSVEETTKNSGKFKIVKGSSTRKVMDGVLAKDRKVLQKRASFAMKRIYDVLVKLR